MKVDKNTKLGKIMKMKGMEKILTKYNVPCVSCPMAKMEIDSLEIGYVCKLYGLPEKEIILEINKILKKKDKAEKPKKKIKDSLRFPLTPPRLLRHHHFPWKIFPRRSLC